MNEEHTLTSLSSFVNISEEVPTKLLKAKSKRMPVKFGIGDDKQIARIEKRYQRFKENHKKDIDRAMWYLFKVFASMPDKYPLFLLPNLLKIKIEAIRESYRFCVGIESQIDSHDYLSEPRWVPFIISKLNPNDSKNPFLVKALQERITDMAHGEIPTQILLTSKNVGVHHES